MKVAYHSFLSKKGKDGALCYYSEVSALMQQMESDAMSPVPHNFIHTALADPKEQARFIQSLGPSDVLLCNFGAYGHLHHLLRERFQGAFRIIRDVQTSSWCGFWLQESLAGPLTREGDLVIFPSEFCRQYYIRLFSHLNEQNTVVCHPISSALPEAVTHRQSKSGDLNVGYIGRITPEKNIDQVFSILRQMQADTNKRIHFHIAGLPDNRFPQYGSKRAIYRQLSRYGFPPDRITYYGELPRERIWEFYAGIDLLLFPSMSCVESLGRVLLEASRARIPILAADYAASPELLPQGNLIKTRYKLGTEFSTRSIFSFGKIDVQDAANKAFSIEVGDDVSRRHQYQPSAFYDLLFGIPSTHHPLNLSNTVRTFIESIVVNRSMDVNYLESTATCDYLLSYFRKYYDRSVSGSMHKIWGTLTNPHSRTDAVRHLAFNLLSSPMELGHANQHCLHADFIPTVVLKPRLDGDHLLWQE